MRAPSPFSAFSTSAPRSTRSTIRIRLDRLASTTLRHARELSIQWTDSYLTGRMSIRSVQRGHLKDCTSHLRCAAGVRPGADPFYHFQLGRSSRHRSPSRLQRARIRLGPTNIWIDGPERCCWSDGSYVNVHRVRRVMDELKSTPAQSIKNRVDMARHESPIAALWRIQHDSLWCWRPASRLCPRSRCPDRQQHDTFESRQQRGWHLLLSATPVTYHPTVPDDRCCTLTGSGSDPHPSRLL